MLLHYPDGTRLPVDCHWIAVVPPHASRDGMIIRVNRDTVLAVALRDRPVAVAP